MVMEEVEVAVEVAVDVVEAVAVSRLQLAGDAVARRRRRAEHKRARHRALLQRCDEFI